METSNLPWPLKAGLGVLTNSSNQLVISIRALIFSGTDHSQLPGALIRVALSSSKIIPKICTLHCPTLRDKKGYWRREKPK